MTRRPLDRRALFASGAAAALLAATGLSAGTLPKRGGKLRLALSGASRSDDWVRGNGLFMQVARLGLVYETLTEIAPDGTLRAGLAVDWRGSPDARHWEFTLRQGVMFHDGVPFTARDVAASAAGFEDSEVRVLDAHRVSFNLEIGDPNLPMKLASPDYYISAAHAMGAGIGTGLYRATHFAPGQQLLAERAEVHWKDGHAGWFDRVELVSIPSEAVRAQAVAEYLVDGADIADATVLTGLNDIAVWDGQAVSRSVAMPATLGRGVFDDLRAPQRWWGA